MKSLYEVLGVERDSTDKEIQSAYRKLARTYHPDVNPGDKEAEEKFKEITAAYSILGDKEKRQEYDNGLIDENGEPKHGYPPGGHDDFWSPFDFINGFRNTTQVRNAATYVVYWIDADKTFETHTANIEYQRTMACKDCNGTGGAGEQKTCEECGGYGRRMNTRRMGNMLIQDYTQCSKCSGRGEVFSMGCTHCNGIGLRTTNETITIDIPANCAGNQAVVQGMGNQEYLSSPPGDLIIHIKPKSQYCKFEGYIAQYELLIDPVRAMLGCKAKAHGLKQKEELIIDIPKMTKPNTRIVIKERGLCDMNGQRHDAHVTVVYKMPEGLSQAQEEALNAYLSASTKEKKQ